MFPLEKMRLQLPKLKITLLLLVHVINSLLFLYILSRSKTLLHRLASMNLLLQYLLISPFYFKTKHCRPIYQVRPKFGFVLNSRLLPAIVITVQIQTYSLWAKYVDTNPVSSLVLSSI